jgi:hypothetical protein
VKEGIYKLFITKEVRGSGKYRWGKTFASPLPVIADALAPLAKRHRCTQQVKRDHVLWLGKSGQRIEGEDNPSGRRPSEHGCPRQLQKGLGP